MKRKTINLIVPMLLSENIACKNRMESFIKVLSDKYKINLITLSKKNEENKIKKLFENFNINYYFVINDNFYKNNFYKRAYKEIVFSKKLADLSKKTQADFVIATSPSMFIIPFLQFDKRKKVLDIRDLVWEYINNNLIKNILSFAMMHSLKKIEKIIVTNQYEKNTLKNYNPEIVYNGIDEEKFNILSSLSFKENKNFVVTYVGNIGLAQNVLTMVKAAKFLKDIDFNIVGDGVEFKKIQNFVNENRLKNVQLHGKKEWNEVLKIYQNSDVLWAQLGDSFRSAVPSKLYEYLSTGLPVVFGGSGEAVELLKDFENCYVHNPGDEQKLVKIIFDLKNKEYKKNEKNINKIRKNFIREKQALKLLNIMEDL